MRIAVFSVSLLLSTLVLADQDPVVITISNYSISAEQALVPIEVFDREEIENSPAGDVSDLLRLGDGMEVGRNGGAGQAASLFFRGTNSNHNLVMVNGVPINNATTASASLGTLDTQLLQQVQIIKGPQTTLWGSGALGGVTNISTIPDANTHDRTTASGSYGADDTSRFAFSQTLGNAEQSLAVGLSHQHSEGMPTLQASDIASGYTNTSFTAAARQRVGSAQLQASHWQTHGTTEYLAFEYPAPSYQLALAPTSQDFLTSVSTLAIDGEIGPHIDSNLQLSLMRDHIDQNDSIDFAHTNRTTLAWRNNMDLGRTDTVSFGAQSSWEEADIESFGSSYAGTTQYQEAFAQYDANRGPHIGLLGARFIHHEDAGNHFTWNLGYGYQATESTQLKLNLATGFRYPTAVERFVFSPNPDLRPEMSKAIELGVTQRLGRGQSLQVSLFDTRVDDLIVSEGVFPNTRNVNINEARIRGADITYQFKRGPWDLHAGLLLQDPKDVSNDEQLLRRARVSAKGRVSYTGHATHVGLDMIYSGERDDVDAISFAPTTTDAYTLFNLFASYDIDRNLQLFTQVENLLNRDYELAAGYNTPDRSVFVGLRYQTD